jgi:hypothetical protein
LCRFWIRDWRGVERGEREREREHKRRRKRRAVKGKAAKVKLGQEPEQAFVQIKEETVWSIRSVRDKWNQAWTGVSCRVHMSCSLESELWAGERATLVLIPPLDGFDFGALPFDLGGAHDETQSVTLQDIWLPDWLDQRWLDGR